ncbi:hypothetical protein [uncultured Oscillibacter sp.]|uniref:hypothetical protein n=1 Tax=uncultured Oscillibacter sp. TaxID=876091 RepID=UPI0025DEADDF|nr:hypothetical protein [uncultured Oscillibacter sp.]
MPPIDLELIISAATPTVAIIAMAYTASKSRTAILTGTYFSEMSSAYAGFLNAAANFVYHSDDLQSRDVLSFSLYRLQLFASNEIAHKSQEIFLLLLDWGSHPHSGARSLDKEINEIGLMMRADLASYRKTGHH